MNQNYPVRLSSSGTDETINKALNTSRNIFFLVSFILAGIVLIFMIFISMEGFFSMFLFYIAVFVFWFFYIMLIFWGLKKYMKKTKLIQKYYIELYEDFLTINSPGGLFGKRNVENKIDYRNIKSVSKYSISQSKYSMILMNAYTAIYFYVKKIPFIFRLTNLENLYVISLRKPRSLDNGLVSLTFHEVILDIDDIDLFEGIVFSNPVNPIINSPKVTITVSKI